MVRAQSTDNNSSGKEDEDGMSLAELIAIIVCGLIVLAFLLMCFIMIRNAQKKKVPPASAKARPAKSHPVDRTAENS